MSMPAIRKYLRFAATVLFLVVVIVPEVLILEFVPLGPVGFEAGAKRPAKEVGNCSSIEPWTPYTHSLQRYGCISLFKNLIFFDVYHDTINAISALLVAIFTFTLWRSTDKLWQASKAQSKDMQASIAEAARAATAMESVAVHLGTNADKIIESVELNKVAMERQRRFSEMQQRAYLSAVVGGAIYQEKEKNWRFEAKPILQNFGFTPAHEVKWRARSAILPIPVPDDFKYTLPTDQVGSFLLPPHLPVSISAIVDDFVDEEDVEKIKKRDGRALHVWGMVSYTDVFGKRRRLTFNHQVYWLKDLDGKELSTGIYMNRHNKSS